MVRSMTGFGRATRALGGEIVSIELSSVNHRHLDPSVRLPSEWAPLDSVLREALKKRISRGKITLTINRRRGASTSQRLHYDPEVAGQYVAAAKDLGALLGTDEQLSLNTLARFDGVFFYEENGQDLEPAKAVLLETLDEALTHLDAMRTTEGKALGEDVAYRIGLLREILEQIELRLPELNQAYEDRLRARIQELNEDAGVTEERIAVEVAVMAEKGDVTEEVVRLKSHLDHALELIQTDEPVGRKLNFLSQEIQREINTLASKVRDTGVTRQALEMKAELEKIREQIQNIE